jgi:hypothetical protein
MIRTLKTLDSGDFIDEGLFIGNAAVETLGGEDAEFGFGQIEPAAELGRVVPFEALDQPGCAPAAHVAGVANGPPAKIVPNTRERPVRARVPRTERSGIPHKWLSLPASSIRRVLAHGGSLGER